MKKYFIILTAVLLISALVLAGCAQPAPSPAPAAKPAASPSPTATPVQKAPTSLSIGTGPNASGFYIWSTGFAVMMEKYAGVKTAPEGIGGAYAALSALVANKVEMVAHHLPSIQDAYRGVESWKQEPANVAIVCSGPYNMSVLWTMPGRGITNFTDLKGKKVIYQEPGGVQSDEFFGYLLKAHGMSPADIKPMKWTTKQQQVQAVDTGEADAGYINTSAYNLPPEFQEQESKRPIQWINVTTDKMEEVVKLSGGRLRTSTFPGGLFKNYPKEFPIINFDSALVAKPDVSEEVVYKLLKAIWDEHNDEFLASWGANKVITMQNTIKAGSLVPYHAGLIKYIKEKGLWTAELQAQQDKVVKEFGSARKK